MSPAGPANYASDMHHRPMFWEAADPILGPSDKNVYNCDDRREDGSDHDLLAIQCMTALCLEIVYPYSRDVGVNSIISFAVY
ncbi:hypothetical protein EG329_008625 [Mollisiaceae sp. DMI_Dod_QoI]|nr:hypothetical protein EG329_008625 [Helotiales sp. DMI_Dod_QoI]